MLIIFVFDWTCCLDICAAYAQPDDEKNQKCHRKSLASLVRREILLKCGLDFFPLLRPSIVVLSWENYIGVTILLGNKYPCKICI